MDGIGYSVVWVRLPAYTMYDFEVLFGRDLQMTLVAVYCLDFFSSFLAWIDGFKARRGITSHHSTPIHIKTHEVKPYQPNRTIKPS